MAVCGRTGCGKSSLFAAILRMYALERGHIRLGGADLARVPMRQVRTAIRLVAQDALLLEGTLLENLYTFAGNVDVNGVGREATSVTAAGATSAERYDEAAAWRELERVGMRSRIEALPDRLLTRVGAGAFSEGERQLLSLCRAFLSGGGRETLQLLLCDEPTSNVDLALDRAVHKALLAVPQTVIMICHRLQHLGGFDRVITIDGGVVVEDGAPHALLSNPSSRLCAICAQVGLSASSIAIASQTEDA